MRERFFKWLAWKLPQRLACWCCVRVGVNATTGKWSDQIVPELRFMDALDRWENRYK